MSQTFHDAVMCNIQPHHSPPIVREKLEKLVCVSGNCTHSPHIWNSSRKEGEMPAVHCTQVAYFATRSAAFNMRLAVLQDKHEQQRYGQKPHNKRKLAWYD